MLIGELARCEYIDKRENVLMIGNPGTGKSHLATALAAQACQKGYRVRFFRTTELVTALIEARDERTFLRLKGQLAKLDLLVLDELGYVPASKVGAELLFDVISTAYERTSLIVTSNLPFEKAHRFERTCARRRLKFTGSPCQARRASRSPTFTSSLT
jgi:DNA replication protein DnaC